MQRVVPSCLSFQPAADATEAHLESQQAAFALEPDGQQAADTN